MNNCILTNSKKLKKESLYLKRNYGLHRYSEFIALQKQFQIVLTASANLVLKKLSWICSRLLNQAHVTYNQIQHKYFTKL